MPYYLKSLNSIIAGLVLIILVSIGCGNSKSDKTIDPSGYYTGNISSALITEENAEYEDVDPASLKYEIVYEL